MKLFKPVIKEQVVDLGLQKCVSRLLIGIERESLQLKKPWTQYFMIGQKYMQYIAMVHNILAVEKNQSLIKIKNYILGEQIMF